MAVRLSKVNGRLPTARKHLPHSCQVATYERHATSRSTPPVSSCQNRSATFRRSARTAANRLKRHWRATPDFPTLPGSLSLPNGLAQVDPGGVPNLAGVPQSGTTQFFQSSSYSRTSRSGTVEHCMQTAYYRCVTMMPLPLPQLAIEKQPDRLLIHYVLAGPVALSSFVLNLSLSRPAANRTDPHPYSTSWSRT